MLNFEHPIGELSVSAISQLFKMYVKYKFGV